jgi:hypothetical protein
MTNDDIVEVTITAPDPDWLIDLCHQLVDGRLAASAHVIHPITSVYRWDGTCTRPPKRVRSSADATRYSANSPPSSSSATPTRCRT